MRPTGGDDQDPFPSALVYAQSERYACEIGASHIECGPEDCEAVHIPAHDARARTFFVGCVEHDPEYLRNAGWRYEGEWVCGCCSLAAFGMEKYGVCRMTSQCKECGCDDADDDEPACTHEDGFSCE